MIERWGVRARVPPPLVCSPVSLSLSSFSFFFFFPHSLVSGHFLHASPSVATLLASGDDVSTASTSSSRLPAVERARAALRALRACPGLASSWDASALAALLTHPDPDARWAAVEVSALSLGLDDGGHNALRAIAFGGEADPAGAALAAELAWDESAAAAAAAKALAWLEVWPAGAGPQPSPASSADPPPPGFVGVEGVWLRVAGARAGSGAHASTSTLTPSPGSPDAASATSHPLVMTASARHALRSAALALADGRPLLIEGPPGCGKSALVAHLATTLGAAASAVTLHAGDQADARALLGSYVAAGAPGEFAWAPGPLALAAAGGRWLVLEGAEGAPPDVLAALAPLLDGGPLPVPQRATSITPTPGFQIIATVATSGSGSAARRRRPPPPALESGAWARVRLDPPSPADAARVLAARLPPSAAAALAAGGLECLAIARLAAGLVEEGEGGGVAAAAALAAAGLTPGSARSGRHYSLRDAARWAARLAPAAAAAAPTVGINPEASAAAAWLSGGGDGAATSTATRATIPTLPAALREAAAAEAVDTFAGALPDPARREALAVALASVWAMPPSWAAARTGADRPAIEVSDTLVRIGRAALPVSARSPAALRAARAAAARASGGGSAFARTGTACRSLEALAVALASAEPVLLVGETGVGKTTLVQWLASQAGAHLEVVNLSASSDAADLLGGFRPSDAAAAAAPLLGDLTDLIGRTWVSGRNDAFLAAAATAADRGKWSQLVAAVRAALKKVSRWGVRAEVGNTRPDVCSLRMTTNLLAEKKSFHFFRDDPKPY